MSKEILGMVFSGIGTILACGGLTALKYKEYEVRKFKLIDNDGNVVIEGSPGRVISYIGKNNLTDADGTIEVNYETVQTNNANTGKVLICISGICLLASGIIAFAARKRKKSKTKED